MSQTKMEREVLNTQGQGQPSSTRFPTARPWVRGSAVVALVAGVALGGLTDAGQTWLPWTTSSLANSGGSWVLVSFALALGAGTVGRAVVRGTVGLVGLVLGFYVTAAWRGVPVAASSVWFWVVAAIVVGPIVGLAADWIGHRSPGRVASGTGFVGGLLFGEAVYGLRFLDGSTSSAYWTGQILVGLTLMLGLLAWRAWRLWAVALALVTAGVVSVLTLEVYVHG